MFDAIMNPGSMTQDQWLIVGILFLLVLGVVFFLYRTFLVIKESTQKKYKPNIGLSRSDDPEQD